MKIKKSCLFSLIGIPILVLSITYIINPIGGVIATIIYITGFFVIVRTLSDQGLDAIDFIFERQNLRDDAQ